MCGAGGQAMAPFTPFFCEMMYHNLRRALPPGAPESVHWCDFPEAAAAEARPAGLWLWCVLLAMVLCATAMFCVDILCCRICIHQGVSVKCGIS